MHDMAVLHFCSNKNVNIYQIIFKLRVSTYYDWKANPRLSRFYLKISGKPYWAQFDIAQKRAGEVPSHRRQEKSEKTLALWKFSRRWSSSPSRSTLLSYLKHRPRRTLFTLLGRYLSTKIRKIKYCKVDAKDGIETSRRNTRRFSKNTTNHSLR